MWNFTPVHRALKEDSSWITVFTPTEPFFLSGQYVCGTHFNTVQHYMVNPNFSDEELGKNSHI